jgi:hypothetical protein
VPALVELTAALVAAIEECHSASDEFVAATWISESVPRFQVTYFGELEQDARKINKRKGSDVFIFSLELLRPSGWKGSLPVQDPGAMVSTPSSSA